MACTAVMQAALIRHCHHNQAGYLAGLPPLSFSDSYHRDSIFD
jgi:hypothetical protein